MKTPLFNIKFNILNVGRYWVGLCFELVKNKLLFYKVIFNALLFLVSFSFAGVALANPDLKVVTHGAADVVVENSITTIKQNTDKVIIEWNSFNINRSEVTKFIQKNASSVALNRINANAGVSKIDGTLLSNGKIILINPAGINFGSGSVVNVGSIIASTSDIINQNFLNEKYIFDIPTSINGSIVNQGSIIAREHGLVALIGSQVRNDGMMQARLGSIVLGSGEKFTFDFYGDQLINFIVDQGVQKIGSDIEGNVLADGVENNGVLLADGGMIVISAKSAEKILDKAINLRGVAQARSVSVTNSGVIILDGGREGKVVVSGKLDASSKYANGRGGLIKILGQSINLQGSTVLDVSGNAGGGEILIGGNYQGRGLEHNALSTIVDEGALIFADAIKYGNGGKVIVWSDYNTKFHGGISAKGGSLGGNGGFVETSGHYLDIARSSIDLKAPKGIVGVWLLDPADLTISSASTDAYVYDDTYGPNGGNSYLNVSDLVTALNSANITVLTTVNGSGGNGDIFVNSDISWSSGNTLTLSAYRNITSVSDITNTGGGSLVLRADNTGTGVGTVTFSGSHAVALSGGSGKISVYYNPTVFGTPDTIYTGDTSDSAFTAYMLINSLGGENDTTSASLATLSNTSAMWDKNFALAKDIDATDTNTWNQIIYYWDAIYNGFSSIGTSSTNFSGKFDGQGYVISNYYSKSGGLFGFVSSSGLIQNLGMLNGYYNVMNYSSDGRALMVENLAGDIINSFVTGRIILSNYTDTIAGLVGYLYGGGSVDQSYSDVNIVSMDQGFSAAGILVGYMNNGSILNSHSGGSIVSYDTSWNFPNIGGVVGAVVNSGSVVNSYSRSYLEYGGESDLASIGGLIGGSNGATVDNSYSYGEIYHRGNYSESWIGGLIGYSAYDTITNSYSFVNITNYEIGVGSEHLGGFVGRLEGSTGTPASISNSYSGGKILNISVNESGGEQKIGGFVGYTNASLISNSYSTGLVENSVAVLDPDNFVGGFIGQNEACCGSGYTILTNNFWDTQTSLQSTGVGDGLSTGLAGVTTADSMSLSNYLSSSWSITDSSSSTPNNYDWFMIDGKTRPILMTELFSSNQPMEIKTAHQLQLMSANLGASYVLGADIDMSEGMNNIHDVWATNQNTSEGLGFQPVGNNSNNFSGDLDGRGHVISNLYINQSSESYQGLFGHSAGALTHIGMIDVDITGYDQVGALVGKNEGVVSASYATGNVVGSGLSSLHGVGGLVGIVDNGGSISTSYSSVDVTGVSYVGGLVGQLSLGSIDNSYSIGSVTATTGTYVGGFVGVIGLGGSSSVVNSYSTGDVSAASGSSVGGFAGYIQASSISGNFWDTATSGLSVGVGGGSASGVTSGIFDGASSGSLAAFATFDNAAWDISETVNTSFYSPASTWFIFDGETRPILMSEYSTTIRTPHQLQLAAASLGMSYTLENDIDMSQAFANKADVWGSYAAFHDGGGFVSIGSLAQAFAGNFYGSDYSISNFYSQNNGLFFNVGSASTITGVNMDNAILLLNQANSADYGLLVGVNNGSIVSSSVSGFISSIDSNGSVGGLVGLNQGGAIKYSNSDVSIDVESAAGSQNIGGLVGNNAGLINKSYSEVVIRNNGSSGGSQKIGGLVGSNENATITNSYSFGSIENNDTNGVQLIGGLVGYNDTSVISTSYSGVGILNSDSGDGYENLGGFIGYDLDSTISDSYAYGAINNEDVDQGFEKIGGFIGYTSDSQIDRVYSSGVIINNNLEDSLLTTGGFIGENDDSFGSTISDSFWDMDTSNQVIGVGAGDSTGLTGITTADFMTFLTFDTANWEIGKRIFYYGSQPYKTWFIFEGATRPILMMEYSNEVTNPHQLQLVSTLSMYNYPYFLMNSIDLEDSMSNAGDIWATNKYTSTGKGFQPIGNDVNDYFAGAFFGQKNVIKNLYINNTTSNGAIGLFGETDGFVFDLGLENVSISATQAEYVGGLAGFVYSPLIRNVYVTGSIVSDQACAGGIVCAGFYQAIESSYNAANVTSTYTGGTALVGGIAGYVTNSFDIWNSYNVGQITALGNANIGGLVGSYAYVGSGSGVIVNSYSSGLVSGVSGNIGGLVGARGSNTTISQSFWDTETSNQSNGVGVGGLGSVFGYTASLAGGTFDGTNAGSLAAYQTYADSNWVISSSVSLTDTLPGGIWYIFDGASRPMLLSEYDTNIKTPHQLQLAGAVLGANYTLSNNIDFESSMSNAGDIWGTNVGGSAGAGFIPLGLGEVFTGNFDGQSNIINNIYINLPAVDNVGVFSVISGSISNLGLINANISGANYTGGLVSESLSGASIDNAFVTGAIEGSGVEVGGLIGVNSGLIEASFTNAYVTGSLARVGGLVGVNNSGASINNSYAMGKVSGNSDSIGGLVGENNGDISNSFSTSLVVSTGSGVQVGGLVGWQKAGSISNSFWDAATSGNTLGYGAYAAGAITDLYGGCFGSASCVGSVSNATNTSLVNLTLENTFNLHGWNVDLGSDNGSIWGIIEGYSYPYLTAFYSETPRAVSGTVWASYLSSDEVQLSVDSTPLSSDTVNGVLAQATAIIGANGFYYFLQGLGVIPNASTVEASLTVSTDSNSTVAPLSNGSILNLDIGTAPDVVYSGSVPVGTAVGSLIDLVLNGVVIGSTTTTIGNTYSMQISRSLLQTNSNYLLYLNGANETGNLYVSQSGTFSDLTGLNFVSNTLSLLSDTASNTALATTIGSLNLSDILFSVTSNGSGYDLVLGNATNPNVNFVTGTSTDYQIDGSIANLIGSSDITLNGSLSLAYNATVSSGVAGSIEINQALDDVSSGVHNLVLSGSGGVTIAGDIGLSSAINNFTVSANSGEIDYLQANIRTAGSQYYGNNIIISNNPVLTALNGSGITFDKTINDTSSGLNILSIASNSGSVQLNGSVGSSAALMGLDLGSANPLTVRGGAITTAGSQIYNSEIVIDANDLTVHSTNGSGVVFNNSINGSKSLTIAANSGLISISGVVGGVTPLTSLTINTGNSTTISGGSVTTTGSQIYASSLALSSNTMLYTSDDISVTNGISGSYTLGLIGMAGDNNFAISGGVTSGLITINGSASGNNGFALQSGSSQSFNITGINVGYSSVGSGITFTNIKNITGGSGTNNFVFANNAIISGNINGGSSVGTNTLNYTSYGFPIDVQLTADEMGITRSNGNIISNFTNIDYIYAPANSSITTPVNKVSQIVFTGPGIGYVGDPVYFSGGFSSFIGGAGSSVTVLFNSGAQAAMNSGIITMNGVDYQFINIESYDGYYSAQAVSPVVYNSIYNVVTSAYIISQLSVNSGASSLSYYANSTETLDTLGITSSGESVASDYVNGYLISPDMIAVSPIVIDVNNNLNSMFDYQKKLDLLSAPSLSLGGC